MLTRRVSWPFVAVLGMLAACTTGDPAPDDTIEVWIYAKVIVCAPEAVGDIRDCGNAGVFGAEVTISSHGEVVWTGETDERGYVEARFTDTGEFVVTASSPFVPEDLTSGPVTPEPETSPAATVTLFTEGAYVYSLLFER